MYNYYVEFQERMIIVRKRIIALLVLIVTAFTLCGSVYAEENAVKTYTLSLDDAIKMMIERDPSFKSADVKLADAERQLHEAYENQEDSKKMAVRISSGISGLLMQKGYYVEQAKLGVESAKREKEQKTASSSYNITQQYYSVKLCEKLLESAQSAYELTLNNKNTIDTQFSLGLVSELDVNNAAYALNQAKAARDKYERNLILARKNFATHIFIDDEEFVLNLTDGIEYEAFETNLQEDVKKALESRYDVYLLKNSVKLAETKASIAKHLGTDSSTYSSANQEYVQSEVTYKNTSRLIALSVNASYNAIIDAKDALFLAEEKLKLSQQEYNIAKVQYELGMITGTQLTSIMNAVTASQIELENAKLTYKLAVEKYGYDITVGLSN